MEREKFMQEARLTAHKILEGKENGIMNLVQRAWAEGKRNAEVETLRAAIDEALDRRKPKVVTENEVYPTWEEWLVINGVMEPDDVRQNGDYRFYYKGKPVYNIPSPKMFEPIPADIAQKLGVQPKEDA